MKETVAAANGGGGFGLVWCCGMVVSAAVQLVQQIGLVIHISGNTVILIEIIVLFSLVNKYKKLSLYLCVNAVSGEYNDVDFRLSPWNEY